MVAHRYASIVRCAQGTFRVLVYALALYGGADLVQLAAADELDAKAYMPRVNQPNGVEQAALEQRVQALEETLDGVTRSAGDLYFSGMNVYVVSGSGSTDAEPNGKGNLIIGYNEQRGGRDLEGTPNDRRNGSHNLVVGKRANYAGFGGVVTGHENEIGGDYAVAIGGGQNRASESFSAIFGGAQNQTLVEMSTAIGGAQNQPGGLFSTITGGRENQTLGEWSSISGGASNLVGQEGESASIAGGSNHSVNVENGAVSGGIGVEIELGESSGTWAAGDFRWP